jgi:hypothetical protein
MLLFEIVRRFPVYYWGSSSCPAQFLLIRVSQVDSIHDKMMIVVEVLEEVFGAVLEAVRCGGIAVNSVHRRTFAAVCAAFRHLELSNLVRSQFGDQLRWRISLIAFAAC